MNLVLHRTPARLVHSIAHVLLLAALATVASAARAADEPAIAWQSLLPPHAGWMLLAGLGLFAVAIAAFSVRRRRPDASPEDDEPIQYRVEPAAEAERAAQAAPAAERAAPPDDAVEPAIGDPAPIDASATPPAALVRPEDRALEPTGAHPFLALHHVDLSIDVLRRHLQREPRPMPAVWIMLLDLCRTHGREHTFRELATEFHRRFNVRAPSWDAFPPDRGEPGLETYPRLVKEITLTWGTHECRRLLDRLLYDNRGGERRGFTLNAYNDLIALRRAVDGVLETIEQDLAEEAKVRSAFASASAAAEPGGPGMDDTPPARVSPLVCDLESQLDSDLRRDSAPQSALESEHPALARMLAREWGNAALSVRLCEMLARGGDGTHTLSREAADDVELLRSMAERLAKANGLSLVPG